MYCKKCGQELVDDAKFCTGCGTAQAQPSVQPVENIQNIPQAQPENYSVENQTVQKSSRNLLPAFIGVAVAALVIAGGVYAGVRWKANQEAKAQEALEAAEIQEEIETAKAEEEARELEAAKALEEAEKAKKDADLAKAEADKAKAQAEAEAAKAEADKARAEADAAKAKADQAISDAEAARKNAQAPTASIPQVHYTFFNLQTASTRSAALPNSLGSSYLWPTNAYAITNSDLSYFDRQSVAAIRNEIYARHGYSFTGEQWKTLFRSANWYHEGGYSEHNLSKLEKDNVATILAYEKSKGWN